ncbi:MAG: 50S ribosomal protein L13 [Chloroflexi bacterium]|nr:50S ribosomal protein L13 [Chloroflexota bacterium]
MHTHVVKPSEIQRQWWVVDADNKVLGRLAAKVAVILRGKHKPAYSSHLDVGDYVVVVNAEKVRTTGKKPVQKVYYRHSGYPGGLKAVTLGRMLELHPTRVLEMAVRGMLPKTVLGKQMLSKLKIYAGPNHPHDAQRPKELSIDG